MANSAHCLVVPFPAQGHISPIFQFSKRLIPKGIRITLAFTRFISATITSTSAAGTPDIRIATISDGYDGGGAAEAENFGVYRDTFREVGSLTLTQLIQKQSDAGYSVHCVVYDSCLPWCLDVAKKFGLMAAPFFTQSSAVDSIYNHVREGLIETPLPGLPPLETRDLPSFVNDTGANPGVLEMFKEQFSNLDKANWVLCNTVYELEQQCVDWLTKRWPNFITVGPTIPSMYLGNQFPSDTEYGFSIFKPVNKVCMNWLGDKLKGSVVYVSFGSLADLGTEQMEELCFGLKNSGYYFLWVVRESEQAKLPNEFSAGEKGLILSWCPQLRVLASGAVGCFLTHCGWNSTLEALSLGVAMVAMPRWSDQTTNAKFIEDVWGVGVRAADQGGGGGENGVVRREEIERCVREVMEGERREEIRRNCDKWKNVVKEAAGEGGSSGRNVTRFAASLIQL